MPKTPFTHVVDKGSEGRARLTRARPLDRGSSGPGRLWHAPGPTSIPQRPARQRPLRRRGWPIVRELLIVGQIDSTGPQGSIPGETGPRRGLGLPGYGWFRHLDLSLTELTALDSEGCLSAMVDRVGRHHERNVAHPFGARRVRQAWSFLHDNTYVPSPASRRSAREGIAPFRGANEESPG
jgi:hypothetical protein